MRAIATLVIAAVLLPVAATASERRFDIVCADVATGPQTRPQTGDRYKIDLARREFCQPWTYDVPPRCKVMPLKVQGRWIDLSYRFSDGTDDWEMYRVYDQEGGWMHQVIRKIGEPGTPYGEQVCARQPFSGFEPVWTPAEPAPAAPRR